MVTPPRRVFGWHTQIPGCAYYRVQLPLKTLSTHTQGGAHLGGKWHTRFGRKLPLTEREQQMHADGQAAAMAERYDVVIGQQLGAGGTGADQVWHAMARHRDRHGGPMLVFETDDNLMAMHGGHLDEAKLEMRARAQTYRRAVEVADVVTCTTPALAEALAPWNPHVRVIPNYVDGKMLLLPGGGQHIKREGYPLWPADEHVLIGWGGSSTHIRDFALVWPALKRLLGQRRDVCFVSMGVAHHVDDPAFGRYHKRDQLHGLAWMDMDKRPWSEYYTRLGWYDVGLAPLDVNPFNEAKSWIKALEYLTMGVVPVVSASPEYRRLVAPWNEHQADYHASVPPPAILVSPGEHGWYPALKALVEDKAELQRMQARARIYARQFTIQGHIGEWAAALAAR